MIQDKWVDNRKLSEEFIDNLSIQERQGLYCGELNLEVDNKKGHLVVKEIYNDQKEGAYLFSYQIIPKGSKDDSIIENLGEIEQEYIKGKSLNQIADNLNENIRARIEKNKKLSISKNEKYLVNAINVYRKLCYLDEDDEILRKIKEKFGKDKEKVLSCISEEYQDFLNELKRLGADVSEYPKSLEDRVI